MQLRAGQLKSLSSRREKSLGDVKMFIRHPNYLNIIHFEFVSVCTNPRQLILFARKLQSAVSIIVETICHRRKKIRLFEFITSWREAQSFNCVAHDITARPPLPLDAFISFHCRNDYFYLIIRPH